MQKGWLKFFSQSFLGSGSLTNMATLLKRRFALSHQESKRKGTLRQISEIGADGSFIAILHKGASLVSHH